MASRGSGSGLPESGRRTRRRAAIWLAPLLILAFLVVSDLFGWAYLRKPVAAFLSSKLQRPVTIGTPFRIHLRKTIPVRIGSLAIAAPEWSKQPHFLTIESLQADVDWGALIGRPPIIRRLAIENADLRLERDEQGRASWSMGPEEDKESGDKGAGLPTIGQLAIGNAKIAVDDAQNALQMQVEARTGDDSAMAGASGSGADTASGAEADRLIASGEGSWKGDPLSFELKTAALGEILKSGAPGNVQLQGKLKSTEIAFDGSVSDLAQFSTVTGNLSAKGDSLGDLTSIPGLSLPATPPYRLEGTVERKGNTVKVEVSSAEIGSSSMTADLEYVGADSPPLLRGSIAATRLVLQDLGPSIGGNGGSRSGGEGGDASSAKAPARDAQGRVLPTREFNLPILRAMNADVAVNLQQLDLGTRALKPLKSLEAKLLLEAGVLSLKDLKSKLAGGTLTGSIGLDAAAAERAPRFEANLNWNRVDLENWLEVADGKYFVAGKFSGTTVLAGNGKSTAAILDSLSGTIKGRIDGGSISHQIVEVAGLDVAQALGVFVGGDERLELTCALVDLKASNGTLRSNLFVLNTSDTLFFVDGAVNFRNEKLDLRLVQSPKDWSPLSLRSPVTIGGTFGKPSVGVDPVPLALKVLSGVVLAAVTPVAALLPLIEPKENTVPAGCAPAIEQIRRHAARAKADAPRDSSAPDDGRQGRGDSGGVQRPGRLPGERP